MNNLVYGANILDSSLAGNTAALADEYGQNIWEKQFQSAAKPYEDAYSKSVNAYEYASDTLKKDYSDAINKAYESYITNKRATEFSQLGTGDQRLFSDAYYKAYDENKRKYYDEYLSGQSQLDTQMAKATETYGNAMYDIMSNIAKEQGTIATNAASVLNNMYNYVGTLDADDEYLFGPTSPLYGLLGADGKLVDQDTFLNRFSIVNEQGQRVLSDDYAQLIKFLNSLETIYEPDETGNEKPKYAGFNAYLLEQDKDLYNWYAENRDMMYKDLLGIENYDYYNPSEYDYGKTITNIYADNYDFDTDDEVTNTSLINVLNDLRKNDEDYIAYRGEVYAYNAKDDRWYSIEKDERAYERIEFDKTGKTTIDGRQVNLVSNQDIKVTSSTVTYGGKTYKVNTKLPDDTKDILNALGDKSLVVDIDGRTYAYVTYRTGERVYPANAKNIPNNAIKHVRKEYVKGGKYKEHITYTVNTYTHKWVELGE